MTTKTKTCEDRIQENLEDRLKDIKDILQADDPIEKLNEEALSWNGYKLELSWGGPADGFLFARDNENNAVNIRYYFQDWFDGAEVTLYGADFDLLEQLYNTCLNF